MARLTAEQVAMELEATAVGLDSLDHSVAAAYRHTANFVREHLIESPDERRARFERWMEQEKPMASLTRDGEGYLYPSASDAWVIWSAALDFGGGGGE